MLGCEKVIPESDENGNLPPGVYFCEWEEFQERTNDKWFRTGNDPIKKQQAVELFI